MDRHLVAVVLVLGFLVCSVSGVLLAQDVEETEYSWGTVSSVSSNQIVVKEYDYDNDAEVEVTYAIEPNVLEFRNVESIKDIAVGDTVDIDYVVKGDKKVAKIITVEKSPY